MASIFICLRQERITAWRGLVRFPNRSLDVGDPAPYAPLLEHGLIQRVYLSDLESDAPKQIGSTSWGLSLLRLIVAPQHKVQELAEDLLLAADEAAAIPERDHVVDLLETVLVTNWRNLHVRRFASC